MFSQAVLAEVIPLRDVFAPLFFISLGMLVNPAILLHNWWLVLLLLALVVVVKGLVIFLLLVLLEYHPFTALITSVSLAQIGEFAFIIAGEALGMSIISPALNSIILAVAILSIALTPMLLLASCRLYRFVRLVGEDERSGGR